MLALSDLDWSIDYTRRLNECINRFEEQGYTVSNGGPNRYVISIAGAVLSGGPDVVATKGDDCIIVDFPQGEPTRSHAVQAMIHMYALPRVAGRLMGMFPRGELAYERELVDIPDTSVDREFIENLTDMAGRLASGEPTSRVPSLEECGRCDITGADCPDRLDETRPFRFPDPPDPENFFDVLRRAEWAEAARDREHEARIRAEVRIGELEEELKRVISP